MLRRKPKAEQKSTARGRAVELEDLQTPKSSAPVIEAAICVEEFRTAPVGVLISRWQRMSIDDPVVRKHPAYFRGLVRLDEGVK